MSAQLRVERRYPAVRGRLLQIASIVISWSPMIAKLFYRLGGFTSLREYRSVLDAYDLTYIPVATRRPRNCDTVGSEATGEGDGDDDPGSIKEDDESIIECWKNRRRQDMPNAPSIDLFYQAYTDNQLTPSDVVEALLPLVQRGPGNSQHSIAFIQVNVEEIKAAAAASTQRYKAGKHIGPLDGVPIAIKDQMDVKGYSTAFGTLNPAAISEESSWCVQQLESAGAIVLGTLNMHELGMDTTNNNPNHGTPRNPHNELYYTGGSSGGSAYVVATGICPVALGADGGGSIRIPASFCGVYGLKPTHGYVDAHPTRNIATSTGVVGPIAATMADLELTYRFMVKRDTRCYGVPMISPSWSTQLTPPRLLGMCRSWYERADGVVKAACDNAINYLVNECGYELREINLPLLGPGQVAHALTILSEVSAATADITKLTPANKILLSIARQGTSLDFILAQKLRTLLMEHLAAIWQQNHGLLLVTPTCPMPGWPIAQPKDLVYGCSDTTSSLRSMEYVWLANFLGTPALSAPVGYAAPLQGVGDIPIGVMLMGEWGTEDHLIEVGFYLERYAVEQLPCGLRRPENHIEPLRLASNVNKRI